MQETWVQSLGREDPLEKEMATHSSTLAWKIPWMEETLGYSSWGHKESDTTKQFHFHLGRNHPGLIPGSRRSDGEGIGYPLQYSWAWSSTGKESVCSVGDLGSIPGLGRSPGEGKGYPLQYSGLENSMNSTSPWGCKESETAEQLSLHFTLGGISPLQSEEEMNILPKLEICFGQKNCKEHFAVLSLV